MLLESDGHLSSTENVAENPIADFVVEAKPERDIKPERQGIKTILLIIMALAIVAIAVGAITVSLYSTQHTWDAGRPCLDCHQDVGDEFTAMAGTQPHQSMVCSDCHQDVVAGYDDEHGANLPQCIGCHPTVDTNLTFDTEAHRLSYLEAGGTGMNQGGNEACIACHTGLDVEAVFERPDYYNFTVDQTYAISNVETSSSNHTNTYTYSKIGRIHTYYDGANVNCSTGGCHQDIDAARAGGLSGGHHTATQPLNVTHPMNAPCTTCHRDSLEVPNTDYHAAKNISCAYRSNGCHDRGDTIVSANMTTIFNEIDTATGMSFQKEGDVCWGCHNGYNWLDPVNPGLRFQVWTEPDYRVNVWNDTTAAFEQVYPRTVDNCADCHDDYETNPVPFGSGKYINHLNETVSNYDYAQCGNCHDLANEPWYPHDVPHDIAINWTAYAAAGDTNVGNAFCDVICHYSTFDSRVTPIDYRDASTTWMKDIYTSFTNDGLSHRTATDIDIDGTVECVDCHPDHEQLPDDTDDTAALYGGSSQQGCGDQDLGSDPGCHLVDNGVPDATDNRETPPSHGIATSWIVSGRDDCTSAGCHEDHNYALDPTEGHNPGAGACHPGGLSCGANSNQHIKHVAANWGIPNYAYNCSQCHFNDTGDLDGWYDTTYGTAEHNDGTVQVRFNTTAPGTVGIATYGNVLVPTYNFTGNHLCANTYCHSDGNVSNFAWGVTPDWLSDNVGCGDCHAVPPTSYAHKEHTGNTMPNTNPWYDFNCSECHYVAGTLAGGWYDTTYGSIQHVDGQVQVAFNTSATGIAAGNGQGPAGTYNGDGTCDNVYCHSNGYDIGGAGDVYYTTPAWKSLSTVVCGDCHGVPNLLTNELDTNVHLKHIRNYGGIYASRNLYWVDATGNPADTTPPYGWLDSIYDPGEAVIQDLNNNRMLDPGVLDGIGSPDVVYTSGSADLTDFIASDNLVRFDDANGNTVWDRNEDIYFEIGGGGQRPTRFDLGQDYILYVGTALELGDSDPTVAMAADDLVMYLDSDHNDAYDAWMDDLGGSWGETFSGREEPLILVTTNVASGSPLLSTYEVLEPYNNLRFWYTDFNRWYDFDCSECHYNNPPTAGYGTYGTSLHVNAVKDVQFDTTASGLASLGGTFAVQAGDAGAWNPGTQECYGIYCHSDGYLRDAIDDTGNGLPDWSGDGIFDDADAAHNRKLVEPVWTDISRTTVNCTSCHYGADKPSDASAGTDKPDTGAHRKSAQHTGQSQFLWHDRNDATPCMECHWRYDTYNINGAGENQWWAPYGSPQHVDGSVMMGLVDADGQLGPLSAGDGYQGGCHNGLTAWRTGYENSC